MQRKNFEKFVKKNYEQYNVKIRRKQKKIEHHFRPKKISEKSKAFKLKGLG